MTCIVDASASRHFKLANLGRAHVSYLNTFISIEPYCVPGTLL